MLKHRIIPIILTDGEQAVKTKQFKRPARPVGSLMQHINTMQERDVDELILIDIDATYDRREPNYDLIEFAANELYCPLTYGGGVNSLDRIKRLLNCGADKVAIKSAAFNDYDFIDAAIMKFGAQCITFVSDWHSPWEFMPLNHSRCGEILLTAVPKEGMMCGYDIELIESFCHQCKVPVIANGGAASPEHMYRAIKAGANAVAASSMFLYTDTTPKDCARYLNQRGVPCRVS